MLSSSWFFGFCHLILLVKGHHPPISGRNEVPIDTFFPAHYSTSLSESLKQLQDIAHLVYNAESERSFVLANNDNELDKEVDVHLGSKVNQENLLFEGDILLTPIQASNILHSAVKSEQLKTRSMSRRSLESNLDKRWDGGVITYRFHSSIEGEDQSLIRDVLNFWQRNTCVDFVFDDNANKEDHLLFFRGAGCYSMVGKYGGMQVVSIGYGCEQFGIIAHEVGHAIGLWHQQSRPDAESYIRVLAENVIKGQLYNFLKRSFSQALTYSIPYDYGSVMHYGPTAFAREVSVNTIETLKSGFQRTIGQREKPSFLDVGLVNAAYCQAKCLSDLPCANGGYTHPRLCNQCLCPGGLGGAYCEENEPSAGARCGGVLEAASFPNWTIISSPGYPEPYKNGQACSWLIKARRGSRLFLKFFGTFDFTCTETCQDYVEVKNASDFRSTGMRFCCASEVPEQMIWSENEMLLVTMRINTNYSRKGFTARLQQYDYGQLVTQRKVVEVDQRSKQVVVPVARRLYEWSNWSSWSPCTRRCGACGLSTRSRTCSGPLRMCSGQGNEHRRCNMSPCEGKTTCNYVLYVDQPCGRDSRRICSSVDSREQSCSFSSCCYPYSLVGNQCVMRSRENCRNCTTVD